MATKWLIFAMMVSIGIDWYFLSKYQSIASEQSTVISRMVQSNEKLINIILSLDCAPSDQDNPTTHIPTDVPGIVNIQPN